MKITKYFYILFCFNIGCNFSEQSNTIPQINTSDVFVKETKASTFVSNIKVIKLSRGMNEVDSLNSFVGNVSKIILKNNNLYILDGRGAGSLKIFSMKGDFLGYIDLPNLFDRIGVNTISDFDVALSGDIYVLNRNYMFTKVFNDQFALKDSIGLKFSASKILIKERDKVVSLLFHKNYQAVNLEDTTFFYNIIETNNKGKFISGISPFKIKPNTERNIYSVTHPLVATLNGSAYYLKAMSDTIFNIDNKSINPCYKIKFKNGLINLGMYQPNEIKKLAMAKKIKEALGYGQFYEDTEKLFFTYVEDSQKKFYFENKYRKIKFSTESIKDNMSKNGCVVPFPMTANGSIIVSVLDEAALVENETPILRCSNGEKIVNDINMNASTYIILSTIK